MTGRDLAPGVPGAPGVVLVADTLGVLGGVQRFVAALARGLAARGLDVVCVEIEGRGAFHPGAPAGDVPVLTVDPGGRRLLPYEPVTVWQRAKLAARGPAAWRALRHRDAVARRLGRLLARFPGATVVFTQLRAAEYGLAGLRRVARADRPRLLVQYHGSFDAALAGGDLARTRRLLRGVEELLVLNDGDADAFARALGRRPAVQRNPVDVRGLVAASGPAGRTRDRRVVVGARYDPEKDLDVLLRAWALAVPERPGWRLEIYGEGPRHAALDRLVAELGVGDSVLLAGPTDDYPGRLRRAALSALSSRHEGMGLVLAEAAACAVPSVTTDAGPGVREVVEHGVTGLVCPVGEAPALAAALGALMDDQGRRAAMGRAARERVARFDQEAVFDQWCLRLGGRPPGQPSQPQAKGRPV
ncbi:glycosyltransferase [Streptomyces sp. NBRC 109706]|uniref:glycosyltransferase n=1 Tax=Streptomyces sp. NBRC 109706 TaxID=1550035 RepID=UPI000783C884|nr:glycosyltransferase [Streptomyces sp. NBRC 109706]